LQEISEAKGTLSVTTQKYSRSYAPVNQSKVILFGVSRSALRAECVLAGRGRLLSRGAEKGISRTFDTDDKSRLLANCKC